MNGIQEAFASAVEWIKTQKSQFSLEAHPKQDVTRLSFYKPLGELLMTLIVLRRSGVAAQFVEEYSNWAWNEVGTGSQLEELLLLRQDLWAATIMYGWFRELGFYSPRVERAVRYVYRTDLYQSQAIVYYRRLEVEVALQYLHGRALGPEICDSTQINAMPEPWAVSEDVAYTTTHEVFYVTDFGKRPELLRPHIKNYLLLWLPVWLDVFRSAGHWDIFGELLTVANILGARDIFTHHCPHFLQVQLGNGVFPGPTPPRPPLGTEKEWDRSFFLDNYHTTMIGLIALAPHVRGGR